MIEFLKETFLIKLVGLIDFSSKFAFTQESIRIINE